jgi:hypothetical protein
MSGLIDVLLCRASVCTSCRKTEFDRLLPPYNKHAVAKMATPGLVLITPCNVGVSVCTPACFLPSDSDSDHFCCNTEQVLHQEDYGKPRLARCSPARLPCPPYYVCPRSQVSMIELATLLKACLSSC